MVIKKKNRYLLLLLFPYLVSCVHSMNERSESEKELLIKAKRGDLAAYSDLKILYLDYESGRLIPVAKYMVDSNKYVKANLDIVQTFFEKYNFDADDTLDISKMNYYDRHDFMKYYNNALKENLIHMLKYKIK